MPAILGLSRRGFLGAAAGAALHASQSTGRQSRWALLSDTHISAERDAEIRGFTPFKNMENAARAIAASKPDGCVVAGDLARLQGTPGDYVQLKAAANLIAPVARIGFCLGNHDDRENFLAAFDKPAVGESQLVNSKHVVVIQRAPVRMVLLDSLIVANETPGFLGKAQRTWLDKYLETTDATPTMLFVHHTLDDEDSSLLDSDRLLRLAAKHSKVKAIFYGHSHRYSYDTFEGVHLVNIPALAYSFNEKQPVGWLDAAFTAAGAELTLHAIAGNTADNGKSRSLAWRG